MGVTSLSRLQLQVTVGTAATRSERESESDESLTKRRVLTLSASKSYRSYVSALIHVHGEGYHGLVLVSRLGPENQAWKNSRILEHVPQHREHAR